jgi:proline iminopeptidase
MSTLTDSEGYVPLQESLRLYYCVVGDGPKTVVIPAATGLAADLESLARGRRIIFYDQRGRGQSDVDPDESHIWIDYEVHDLEAIRHHFDLERLSIIGWSYMGGISALYAATHPAHVDRLVLMCAISPRSDAPYNDPEARAKKEDERIDTEGAKRLREMQQQGLDTSDPETYCREFHRVYIPRQMGKPEALTRMRSDPCAFANEWPHYKAKNFPPVVTQWDWRQKVTSAKAPTLVIHGAEDLIPEDASREWTTTLPEARLLIIPGSGHFPHLEASDLYFSAVDQFLNGEWPEGAEAIDDKAT